ncbi:MAG TPA: branched-chain amino acid ABC transporter permease [Vicinamibacterales bacterium]|jgi:branched-chain amino acid transport system permease protein|nr:branched-chain amino acid ABC transporter permease [Vicinamibacterales bacterium]
MALTIWTGLTLGSIYALVASGFVLSLLPSGVFNFAQGAIVVAGTFFAYHWLSVKGLSEWETITLLALVGAFLGLCCELLTIRPLRWRGGSMGGAPTELVTTVGMSTAMIGAIGIMWGYNPLLVPFKGPTGLVKFAGIFAQPVEVILVVAAIVVALGLWAFFRFSRLGQACLAVAEDREAAMLRGVNVSFLSIAAFAAAGALGGMAGALVGPITYAIATSANTIALGAFVAMAIGGEGSFIGALCGGLFVGLVSSFTTRYLGAYYSDLSIFVALLATLSIRPRGLGGGAAMRRV